MANILLLDDKQEMKKILALNLQVYVDVKVVCKETLDETLDFIKSNDIAMVIAVSQIEGRNAIDEIYQMQTSISKWPPLIGLGKLEGVEHPVTFFDRNDWRGVVREAASILKVTAQSMVDKEDSLEDYFPIDVTHLSNIQVEECATDVYVRDASGKIDPIIEAGQEFPVALINDLVADGTEQVYLRKEDRLKFINQFTAQILEKMQDEDLDDTSLLQVTETGLETFKDILSMSGMNETAMELADKTIKSMSKAIDQMGDLDKLLSHLLKDCSSYRYKHSMLTAALSTHIVSQMDWGSPDQRDKLCFVAFFHDIALADDSHAMINTDEELDQLEASKEVKNKINRHAYDAVTLLEEHPKVPYGVSSVILQHHGQLNGIGFTVKPNRSLSPLAIVFMVAEEYANILLTVDPEFFNKENAINMLKNKYDKGMFLQVVEALEN